MSGPEPDTPDDEAPAPVSRFFSFCDASSLPVPESGTSPMSKVSGSFSEESFEQLCNK